MSYQIWEYRVVVDASPRDLNRLGLEGWELAAILTESMMLVGDENRFYFKRPKLIARDS